MKRFCFFVIGCLLVTSFVSAQAPDTEQWPPQTDFSQDVHFWSADGFLSAAIPSGEGGLFTESLTILSGGDQKTEDVTIGGEAGKKSVSNFFNVADELFFLLPDYPVIDILVQYFTSAESQRDNMGVQLGQVGNIHSVGGFTFESLTDQWEWRLFRVDNSGEWAGNQINPDQPGSDFGGINGGTIRLQRTQGLIFRAIAFGPEGAFGEPEDINVAETIAFNPDDYPIIAEWDIHNGVIDGLDVYRVDQGDQEIMEAENIGPADDKRTAIRPAFNDGNDDAQDIYVNWEILDEHFGPTEQSSTRIKLVAEYYDDPALAGERFGPEVYVTAGGDLAFYPDNQRTTLQGTGKWLEDVWYVPDVKFDGVNVQGQAAARFWFTAPIHISRLRLGVIRASGQYEGVDPIPDAYPFDPDPYENYAELDLDQGITNGLDMGGNGGDQEYFIDDNIGPDGDKRTAVRPALSEGNNSNDIYMNFAILDEIFGPSDQPNAVFKVVVDYYDDPALAGERFGPEVYQSETFGTLSFHFYPDDQRQTLEGTGEWQTAAWKIDDMNFSGVNVSPQGAARFWFSENCAVYISRVRYGVIRPVGENAGVDPLEEFQTNVANWVLY